MLSTVRQPAPLTRHKPPTIGCRYAVTYGTQPAVKYLLRNSARYPRSREDWLTRLAHGLRGLFASVGHPLPLRIRVTCGFPSKSATARKKRRVGECWADSASKGRYHEILVSPLEANPIDVGTILVHELCHTVAGVKSGHRGPFRRLAIAAGLEGKMTETTAGPDLKRRVNALIRRIGPYPHSRLVASNAPKTQTTRMVKVECVVCRCVVRMTRKWLDEVGPPTCGCGGEMAEDTTPNPVTTEG